MLAFGLGANARARQEGKRKAETLDFLGFTHCGSIARDGKRFRMKRLTARKRFRGKLAAFQAWLKQARGTMRSRELWQAACDKLRGHYAYYGVTDNWPGLARFAYQAQRLLKKWLGRRGGKRRLNWHKFALTAKRFPLPQPRITVTLF